MKEKNDVQCASLQFLEPITQNNDDMRPENKMDEKWCDPGGLQTLIPSLPKKLAFLESPP